MRGGVLVSMSVSELPAHSSLRSELATAASRAGGSGGQGGRARERNSVSSAPRGLPVAGSPGQLGGAGLWNGVGCPPAAGLLNLFMTLFAFISLFITGQHQEVVFISFLWGGCPLLCSLSLFLSLSDSAEMPPLKGHLP